MGSPRCVRRPGPGARQCCVGPLQNRGWMLVFIFILFYYYHFGGPHHAACRILVPRPGIEPMPPAVEAGSLSHWTAREVPQMLIFKNRAMGGVDTPCDAEMPRLLPDAWTSVPSVHGQACTDSSREHSRREVTNDLCARLAQRRGSE